MTGPRTRLAALAAAAGLALAPTFAAAEGPAMWRVTDADSEIYLFGTFHILPASIDWTTPALDEAMARTPFTMTEADTDSPQAQQKLAALVQELGLNPPGVTLSSELGPERAKKLAKVAERYGMPMATLEPLRPWLALLSLTVGVMQQNGYSAEAGAEAVIRAKAAGQKDAFAYLETAEFQIRTLAGLGNSEWLADFERTLEQMEDFDGFSKRALQAWSAGDLGAIEAEMIGPMRKAAPGAYKALIADRNANWVKEIEAIMTGPDDYFIAAGAGHFIGKDGVVERLKKKGYAVERVQ